MWRPALRGFTFMISPRRERLFSSVRWQPQARRKAIVVAGGYAYFATGKAGLRIIDVHNPVVPFEIGSYAKSSLAIQDVAVQNAYAYATSSPSKLLIIDLTDPARPAELGALA